MNRAAFHVAIVGGGLVGCVAALKLKSLGFAVTLLEQRAPALSPGALGVEIRNVALAPAAQRQLHDVGVWAGLVAAPYENMVVWEEWGVSELRFAAAQAGRVELGWVVEMGPLVARLWQRLGQAQVATEICSIDRVDVSGDGVRIRAGGSAIDADFVIGADGANSIVRRALDVPVSGQPTRQAALATVVRTRKGHANTAWQRFLCDGPLALLPSPDPNVCSVVWTQSPERAARRQALSEAEFCRDIGSAFEHRLGDIVAADRRVVFPLTQQCVKSCTPHERAVLLGDAMRVIHPLAGLGVNLGLEDVAEFVKVAAQHTDLASGALWRRFGRQRLARSAMMIKTMASLNCLYGSPSPALGWLRNAGVQAVNRQDWLKRQIMREALGMGPIAQSR